MLKLIEDLGYLYAKETSKQKVKYGIFKCFCGNNFKAQFKNINNKNTKSCGCSSIKKTKEANITHGLTYHRLYSTWKNIIHRCINPNHSRYKDYGSRGITVCNRWLTIENFIEDMYPTFQEGLSIDRINNDLGYSKDNCRWVTKSIQQRNTRKLRATNTSGYRGVCKFRNKWSSQINIDNKQINIGYFDTAIEAAKAYDQYVIDNNLEHTTNWLN